MTFSFSTPAGAGAAKPAPQFSFGTPAATPNLFGATGAPAQSTSLFGQSQPAASSSLFGQPAPATTGLFGNTSAAQPTTGLFGAASTSQPATGLFGSTPASGGLFGTQTQTQTPPTTGLFGQQPQSTGLFGSTQPSTGLFGSQPAASTSNLFGTQPAQSMFGSQPAQSGLFGSQPAQGGLFGSQPAQSGLFGSQQPQQQQQQQQSSLFAPQQPSTSLSQSIMGLTTSQNPQQAQAAQQAAEEPIQQRILKIKNSYDPANLQTNAFQVYVYNIMDQQRANYVAQYGGNHPRTAQDTPNDALWLKANRENPDTKRYYPQLVVGLDQLKKRVGQQEDFAQKHKSKLDELSAQLQQISSAHSLQTSIRLQKASHAQNVLSARLIRLVARLHALTPMRATAVTAAEESLKTRIESLAAAYAGTSIRHGDELEASTTGKMANRINELWIAASQLKARRPSSGSSNDQEWTISNEDEVNRVLEVLAQQQRTLDYLGSLVKQDESVLNVIKTGFNEPTVAQTANQREREKR